MDTSELVNTNLDQLQDLSLRIQIAATGVASSFLLIFVPNVETITFISFLVGFLFSPLYALSIVITMVFTWEVLVSMVFSFSGITFLFKLIAWTIITLLGLFARKINARYSYEFILFGALSAILYDLIVTLPIAIFFVQSEEAFLPLLISSFVIGVYFTISHTLSNALFFSFMPRVIDNILPLLNKSFSKLLKIDLHHFAYIENLGSIHELSIKSFILTDKKRLLGYTVTFLLIIGIITASMIATIQDNNKVDTDQNQQIRVNVAINYDGVLPTEAHEIDTFGNQSVLEVLKQIATVNYTSQYYVMAINDVWEQVNLSNHGWTYYVNGIFANRGANDMYLDEGDNVEWRYVELI